MHAAVSYVSGRRYQEMASERIKSILTRSDTPSRRLRTCSESFSELGFLMLIAYQLEDIIEWSQPLVDFPSAFEASSLPGDDVFDFRASEAAPAIESAAEDGVEAAFDDALDERFYDDVDDILVYADLPPVEPVEPAESGAGGYWII